MCAWEHCSPEQSCWLSICNFCAVPVFVFCLRYFSGKRSHLDTEAGKEFARIIWCLSGYAKVFFNRSIIN